MLELFMILMYEYVFAAMQGICEYLSRFDATIPFLVHGFC